MSDAFHTSERPSAPSEIKKSFVSPALEYLGVMHEITRGPGMGTEDAVIFAPGGDPTDDPS